MGRTLIIRLSAFGDVAMSIPIVYSVARENPREEFVMITKKFSSSIFINKPDNLKIIPIDTYLEHGEWKGLWRLIQAIGKIDKVADLHDVLRTKVIRNYFRIIRRKPVAVIDKGKKEKRALTRKKNKIFKPLTSSFERYRKVFEQLGFEFTNEFISLFEKKEKTAGETLIGIAPFSKHQGKIYPIEQMERVIESLSKRKDTRLFLFGSRSESPILENWENTYPQVESVAGKLTIEDELLLMNRLDLMISMDSANMHLASLVNTPVLSIWGATHPYTGFYGYRQNPDNAIQIEMDCRPCSVFGKKPCWRKDHACMRKITPEMIIEKVNLYAYENRSESPIRKI